MLGNMEALIGIIALDDFQVKIAGHIRSTPST